MNLNIRKSHKRVKNKMVKFRLNRTANLENNKLDTMKIISNNNNELIVTYEKDKLNIDRIIESLNTKNIKILDLSTDDGDLEDVFIDLTKN